MIGFTEEHIYTHESGRLCGTGLVAKKHSGKLAVYTPAGGTIDRSQWPSLLASGCGDLSPAVKVILNQLRQAMVLGLQRHASRHDARLAALSPPDHVRSDARSACDRRLRRQLDRRHDYRGADLGGCVPVSDTGSDPAAGNLCVQQRKWAANWKADAAKHVITGWNECPSSNPS